jgi:hypothetical protein
MTKKLNLARLNKKREEISESEMAKFKAGNKDLHGNVRGGDSCECECAALFVYEDVSGPVWLAPDSENCVCASIWVIFGLMI